MPFQSAEQQQLDTVEARLLAVEADLQAVEGAAPAAALRVHTGTPEDGDADLLARLPVLRAECASLYMARDAATQAEADRLELARLRALASSARAAQQHLSKWQSELENAALHGSNMQRAYERAAAAGRSALAAMPPKMRVQYMLTLAPKRAKRLLMIETHQVAKRAGQDPVIPEMLGWSEDVKGWASGQVPTLQTLLMRDVEPIRAQLRQFIPSSSAGSPFLADDTAAALEDLSPASGAVAPIPDASIDEAA
jgi:hypothetical protein